MIKFKIDNACKINFVIAYFLSLQTIVIVYNYIV